MTYPTPWRLNSVISDSPPPLHSGATDSTATANGQARFGGEKGRGSTCSPRPRGAAPAATTTLATVMSVDSCEPLAESPKSKALMRDFVRQFKQMQKLSMQVRCGPLPPTPPLPLPLSIFLLFLILLYLSMFLFGRVMAPPSAAPPCSLGAVAARGPSLSPNLSSRRFGGPCRAEKRLSSERCRPAASIGCCCTRLSRECHC